MMPDAEVISVVNKILVDLDLGKFVIKLNSRKILDAMIELSGAPKEKFNQICSAIDKLDKMEWKDVRKELVEDKGIKAEAADKIGEFVKYQGSPK